MSFLLPWSAVSGRQPN